MELKRLIYLIVIALIIIVGWNYVGKKLPAQTDQPEENLSPPDRIERVEIVPESTFGILMDEAGIAASTSQSIFNAAVDVYDLSKIRLGRTLNLVFDHETDEFKRLIYQIDSEEELYVTKQSTTTASTTESFWFAERKSIDYEIKVVTGTGTVDTSMYQAALDGGIDERAIIELADAFQWSVDFALDPRVGDTFKFIYEQRYRDGQYVGPGQILAGKYINDGTPYYTFYFPETEDNTGFFDQDGNSVQKIFLKAPVAFRYISSGYTTGPRYIPGFSTYTSSHRAIDYVASVGTPIRAVGDGTVVSAGWNSGGYGYLTSIRHNGTYTTNYAHQSKIAVKAGQKVTQGQTIGYVGSTGFSTGPHLHFEMVKNGVKINPLTEILPPGEPIKEENQQRFFDQINPFKEQLDS